jgi:hypothetical protein
LAQPQVTFGEIPENCFLCHYFCYIVIVASNGLVGGFIACLLFVVSSKHGAGLSHPKVSSMNLANEGFLIISFLSQNYKSQFSKAFEPLSDFKLKKNLKTTLLKFHTS